MTRFCTKCGMPTGMVVEETKTGKVLEEIPLCYNCLWSGLIYNPPKEQITLTDKPSLHLVVPPDNIV